MTKIRCTLPNASEEMNGIKFAVDADGGVVSVDAVPADMAEIFLSIPGFTAEVKKGPVVDPEQVARDAAEAQRIKDEKAAEAKALKDKKAADALSAKEAVKAAKGVKPAAEETPAADADAKAPGSTEGTESTQAAEVGKPEGEV